jgi:hypothetical protein
MILDALLKFSENQVLATGAAFGTNVVDLGTVRDIGVGEPMAVTLGVDVLAVASGTYQVEVVQSNDPALAGAESVVSRTILAPLLTAGALFTLEIPQNAITKQYLGVRYTLGGTSPAVTVTAFLQPHNMASVHPRHYADAITIT